jgi:uncharacterized membrane protein
MSPSLIAIGLMLLAVAALALFVPVRTSSRPERVREIRWAIAIWPLILGVAFLARGFGAHASRSGEADSGAADAEARISEGLDNVWFFYCTTILVVMCLFWLVKGLWRRQLDQIIVPSVFLALTAAYFAWIVATNRVGALLDPIKALL